jgi:hypothetical protein
MNGHRRKVLRRAFAASGVFKNNPRAYFRQDRTVRHTVNGPWRRFKTAWKRRAA